MEPAFAISKANSKRETSDKPTLSNNLQNKWSVLFKNDSLMRIEEKPFFDF